MVEKNEMTLLSIAEAEAFVFMEARLIDDNKLEEWLTLFTDDGIYWIPSDESAEPESETSIIYDNTRQREKRIYQLRNKHLAQDPLSRTIHFITNIEVEETESPTEVLLRCNTLIYEMRPGDHQQLQKGLATPRAIACRCCYHLRQSEETWRIAMKQVNLINRDLPLQNITFIL
ncbi:MAG: 3-phenylpropionate/cinnamic acid dioxygenase small subunit [Gammaproteobacteria bacterium]|jgi:3-phenylpropionate/cinnamic acid dioxygenase small subunit